MTLPLGLGIYSDVALADLALALPRAGAQLLVMSTPTTSRHTLAHVLTAQGHRVTRRFWLPDDEQLDFSQPPESEAGRWFGMLLGGLTPEQFRAIYARAVGPNEQYGDPATFGWLAAFELALCRLLRAVGIDYAWGSISSGNVDAVPFATIFAGILSEAAATCYHLYAEPYAQTLEGPAIPWWARRPWDWFQECKKRGVRFAPLLGGESGTYYPWHPKTSSAAYVALLGQISDLLASWRAAGMPVLGHCAFAAGAEGTMGQQWNLDRDALTRIGAWNKRSDVDYSEPQEAPVTQYSSPNHDGPRAQTLGIVLHATLGGSASPQTEYDATLNWFNSPASQVSAQAVVGPGGQVAYPVDPANIAWHCRASNATWLGIEMCKSHVSDDILPEIIDAAAKIVAGWCKLYAIPITWSTTHGLAEHREMPTNMDGHQDVGGPFDRADFLRRVQTYGGELTDQQKAAVLDDLGMIWGMSNADTIKANPAESDRAIKERVVAIKVVLGING